MTTKTAKGEADRLVGSGVLKVETPRISEVAMRALDIFGAAALLLLLSPILLVVAVLIRLDSRGGAIFRQERIGRDLKPFRVAKFRTMRRDVAADPHRRYVEEMIRKEAFDGSGEQKPMAKLQKDPRITGVGGFLRRSSIDELPQLWNVLRGDMSLVGPRPPIQYEVDAYPARAFRRFAVRPGLTGLWQVRGRSLVTFQQMIDFDTEYVEQRSFVLNVKILLLTIPTVLHGKGAE